MSCRSVPIHRVPVHRAVLSVRRDTCCVRACEGARPLTARRFYAAIATSRFRMSSHRFDLSLMTSSDVICRFARRGKNCSSMIPRSRRLTMLASASSTRGRHSSTYRRLSVASPRLPPRSTHHRVGTSSGCSMKRSRIASPSSATSSSSWTRTLRLRVRRRPHANWRPECPSVRRRRPRLLEGSPKCHAEFACARAGRGKRSV